MKSIRSSSPSEGGDTLRWPTEGSGNKSNAGGDNVGAAPIRRAAGVGLRAVGYAVTRGPMRKRMVQIAFGSAIAVLLVVGTLAYRSILVSNEGSGWVEHTHEVLENLEASQFAMETIAGSVRGFVLTGDETYLKRYQASLLSLTQHEAAVRSLTVDNAEQQRRMTDLETLTAERVQRAKRNIGLRREQGLAATADIIRRGSGQQATSDFKAIVSQMQNEELRLLAIRNTTASQQFGMTKAILFVGTGLGLLITGAAFWCVQRDISRRELAEKALHDSAQHDILTGLPNRMLLSDRIGRAIVLSQRHGTKVAVLFLDLDGFKHVNDSLGHSIGDKLLQSVAKRLEGCVRASDTVSRQGGDEFVVLLSEVQQAEDVAISARRILEAVATDHPIDAHNLHVTTSIGMSVYPDDGADAETLIKNADIAMYQAKENGRQSYQFFEPAMNVRAMERQFIEAGLRRALERHEFEVHYQPKVDLRTGRITGAEALIRWTHPVRGPISPVQFIPVAEECGLILPIGAWVLREACNQARAWADAGLPAVTMAVNVSAMEFRDEKFLEGVFAILSETGMDPRKLELELTESVLMKRAESTARILQSLRESGVRVAVDDFGTGYSSLSYLRKFPVDALKIDSSFIRQLSTDGDDTTIVTAVIGMARSLNLRVVAEGVETREQLAFLRAHQCDDAQGHYFSPPVLPGQFAKLVRTGLPNHVSFQRPVLAVEAKAGRDLSKRLVAG